MSQIYNLYLVVVGVETLDEVDADDDVDAELEVEALIESKTQQNVGNILHIRRKN